MEQADLYLISASIWLMNAREGTLILAVSHLNKIVADEGTRIAMIRDYALLVARPEPALQRIMLLIADVFGVVRADISLVDEDFQRPHQGDPAAEVPGGGSFFDHILRTNAPLIVPEATSDPRFMDRLVRPEDKDAVFYAGVPLRLENGFVLGALSIADQQPRPTLTAGDIRRLEDFSAIIMAELNLRQAVRQRDDARTFLESAVTFSDLVVWQLDAERASVTLKGAVAELWGFEAGEVERKNEELLERIHPEDRYFIRRELLRAIKNRTHFHHEFRVIHPTRDVLWMTAKADWALRDQHWVLTGINADITEQKERQEHANLLMRELHHRMRNLFATVGAIVSLTRQSAEHIDDYIERISYRLDALNRAQNVLLSANFMTGSMHALMREVEAGFPRISWSGPDLLLPENALVSMALLLNELATNAVKHGALMSDAGTVEVHWWHEDDGEGAQQFHMRWIESGTSHDIGPPERTRFGTLLMDRSVRNNLGGQIERRWEAKGLICDIIMPARWREN